MNGCIVKTGILTMSSVQLANLLNYEKKEINKKIRSMFGDDTARENFSPVLDRQGRVDYYNLPELESKMFVAKHNIDYLETITQFWIDRNKVTVLPDFTNPAEAARAWADEIERKQRAEQRLLEQKSKVRFYDNLVERHALMTATQVAQKHKISAVKLNKFLDELGGVYNGTVKRSRVFTQSFIDQQLGEMKQTDLGFSQALFTPAGEMWVAERLYSEGMVSSSYKNWMQ
ncbi:phage antirepressor KilAC domain-containing protein [Vibrio sp. La 4.2.2]|uniref:phage antirepressor KilAC domain-containing protein n=1 Tax=Vibrio sp. La 4.2.2 TaxID=2998830 RepID=UPI0022CE3282|nr:phage antirepressor KilAC domain-containing protein [Vibrio sp. La 4.2.2]MDA0107838.1 phage antirepressor KilAC domain-containing protein [Vibrio sp. La 4.2.2]